jgi:hypothetical protein
VRRAFASPPPKHVVVGTVTFRNVSKLVKNQGANIYHHFDQLIFRLSARFMPIFAKSIAPRSSAASVSD